MSWNELEFISWRQFQQMAPSIIRLEITRLGGLIEAAGLKNDVRNDLVRVRFELRKFIVEVEGCADGRLSKATRERLDAAIVNLPLDQAGEDEEFRTSLAYILDRLRSIQKRIDYIYV